MMRKPSYSVLALVLLIGACGTSPSEKADGGVDLAVCAPSDCPATGTVCATPSCLNNACDKTYTNVGATCDEAGGKVCDGNGSCVACVTPTDCATPTTACKTNTCTANVCGTTNVPSGSCNDNGGKVCDGNGTCVACLAPADCPTPTTVCKLATCDGAAHTCGNANAPKGTSCTEAGGAVCDGNGACVSMHCTDGVQDADETDLDCGGASCSPCADTLKCTVGSDCTNQICDSGHHCALPTCSDGVRNGNESDTDCGGTGYMAGAACPKCADKLHCANNADCVNNDCVGSSPGICISCSDGIKNGNETDMDCGGGTCAPCAVNKACTTNTDCASNACDSGSLTCVASQCSDHRLDGNETDLDCGGGTCPACAVGLKCGGADSNCVSQACDAVSLTCVGNQCGDHRLDGNETDLDCGGGTCPSCLVNERCASDSDCASNACDAGAFICVSSQCADHRKDGAETDEDCGGGVCATCATGLKCRVDSDCVTQACDAVALVCDTSQCIDNQKDGAETDLDCGGGICPACSVGKTCSLDSDCTSAACDDVTGRCSASQCTDQKKDGAETDADCGGGTCATCAIGLKCQIDSDCSSSACDALTLTCISSACADHRKDYSETDIDCGGGTCAGCGTGLKCQVDSDCSSNACDALTLTCVTSQCADHRKDGSESDLDCGGGICPACAVGKTCLVNFDCQSGHVCNASRVCQ